MATRSEAEFLHKAFAYKTFITSLLLTSIVNDLEDILEISLSIMHRSGMGVKGLEEFFPKSHSKQPESSAEKPILNPILEAEPAKNAEERPIAAEYGQKSEKGVFVNMYKAFISKMYEYKASAKDAMEKAKDGFVGYTDKMLKEMEDWGYFYFSTVFKKLKKLTPFGQSYSYLQEIYVVVVKSVKT